MTVLKINFLHVLITSSVQSVAPASFLILATDFQFSFWNIPEHFAVTQQHPWPSPLQEAERD